MAAHPDTCPHPAERIETMNHLNAEASNRQPGEDAGDFTRCSACAAMWKGDEPWENSVKKTRQAFLLDVAEQEAKQRVANEARQKAELAAAHQRAEATKKRKAAEAAAAKKAQA